MEAALALISVSFHLIAVSSNDLNTSSLQCATRAHDYLGLFHLFKLFQTQYCFEPDVETSAPFDFRCIPKTNDFSDIGGYFLKKVRHLGPSAAQPLMICLYTDLAHGHLDGS